MRFIALIEKDGDAFGASFPQLPGCVAMGCSMDDVMHAAADALAEWIGDGLAAGRRYEPEDMHATTAREDVRTAIAAGAVPAFVPLLMESGRSIRANLSLDAGLLSAIDAAAKERGMTRSSWLASAARSALTDGH